MTTEKNHGHVFGNDFGAAPGDAIICTVCDHVVRVSSDVPDEGAILDGTITRVRDDLKGDLDKLPEGALPVCPGTRPIGP
jgi:hypothetical protein